MVILIMRNVSTLFRVWCLRLKYVTFAGSFYEAMCVL